MWLPSGSRIMNRCGAPGAIIGSESIWIPSIADKRRYSPIRSAVSMPMPPPPGSPPIGGLSARRAVEPGGATSSHRASPFSPKRTSARNSQPIFSV